MILTSFEERGIKKGYLKGKREGIEKGIERGIEKGIEKGIERGKLEGIHTTAKNMRKLGLDISVIQKTTGLSESEIKKL